MRRGAKKPTQTTVGARASALVRGFGFTPRMKLDDLAPYGLRGRSEDKDDYIVERAPLHHPYFECFVATVSPTFGLWRVVGIGKDIPMTATLAAVRKAFSALERPLVKAFGPGHQPTPDPSWPARRFNGEPNDLMDSRGVLCRWWSTEDPLPPEVEGIVLFGIPNDDVPDAAYVRLAVTFRFYDPRLDKRRRKKRGARTQSRYRTRSAAKSAG